MAQKEKPIKSCSDVNELFQRPFAHRNFFFVILILAIILTLPSLWSGLAADDFHHKLLMDGSDSPIRLLKSPLDMFNFFDGDSQHASEFMDYGLFPWWTYKKIKAAFWRPLASLTHWLDYTLWPDIPFLMHAQSILWYVILVISTVILYRRFISPAWIAGLAALLYAIDHTHGMPVGFLSNRNAIMATFFGVLAIIAHDKWRRDNWNAGLVFGLIFLAASLLSAEAGIATCAYLAAYMLFIDESSWQKRIVTMMPYFAVVVIWRFVWTYLGYGIANIGAYIDPLSEPLRYINAVKDRAPFLLLGQWALPPSDITTLLPPKYWIPLWYIALIFLVLLTLLFLPILKRQRTARFLAMGMLLSVVPISATFPSDRLLMFVGIGAMGLIAQFLAAVFERNQDRPKLNLWRIPANILAIILIICHLVISPLLLPVRSAYPMVPKKYMKSFMIIDGFDESIKKQDLVIVNPPVAFLMSLSPMMWEAYNRPMPRHFRVLTSSLFQPMEIYRPDINTLVIKPGYGYYAYVLDSLFRNNQHPFSIGDKVELEGITVEITELTNDNRPAEAAFRFDVPLEDTSLRWLQFKDGDFISFTPPDVGQTVFLEGGNIFLN